MGSGCTPTRAGAARGAAGSLPTRPTAAATKVLRSLVLAIAMFAVAALAGVLLSGAAPASRADQPAAEPGARGERSDVAADAGSNGTVTNDLTRFGRSMVVSGTAALAVSVAGMVIVGRRRRLW